MMDLEVYESNFTGDGVVVMAQGGYVAAAAALLVIGLAGCLLNAVVIVMIWKYKQLWSPINTILLNLACGDLLISVFGNPLTFSSAVARKWIFGEVGCKLYGFSMALLGIASITTLAVLAFERYLIVCKPFTNYALGFRGAYLIIAGVWGYATLLTTPPLFGWGKYVNEAANISCSVNWEERSYNSKTYILYLFAMGLMVPLCIIVFSYCSILYTMRQSAMRVGRTSATEMRVACMVLLMIVAFLVAWLPYAILALIIQFGDASIVTPALAVAPALLAKSSICYNPVIYVGLNSQFRQAWLQIFRRAPSSPKWSRNENASNSSANSGYNITRMLTMQSAENCRKVAANQPPQLERVGGGTLIQLQFPEKLTGSYREADGKRNSVITEL